MLRFAVFCGRRAAPIAVILFGLCTAARGEVSRITSRITTEVQEYVDGEPVSLDSAFELFPTTSDTLPIEVVAGLGEPDGLGAFGAGFSIFRDPTRDTGSLNPEEFGVEATCVSLDPSRSYDVRSSARETRTIRLLPADIGGESQSGVPVTSQLFLSGAMVIWAEEPGRDLTGVEAEVILRVVRRRASLSDPGIDDDSSGVGVFFARIQLTGGPNGQVTVQRSGPLRFQLDSGGAGLVDQPSPSSGPSSLRLVEKTLDEFGTFHVLLVPDQIMSYSYASILGASFDLEATLETRVSNVPGGTGAAAAFGVPLSDLDDALDVSVDSLSASEAVQAAVNAARDSAASPSPTVGRTVPPRAGACGAVGVEVLGMAMLLSWLALSARIAPIRPAARRVDLLSGRRYIPPSMRDGRAARRIK